jgi:hypothetical protein
MAAEIKTCMCGKEFAAIPCNKAHCSEKCRLRAKYAASGKKVDHATVMCIICGKLFIQQRNTIFTCSAKCAIARNHQRSTERNNRRREAREHGRSSTCWHATHHAVKPRLNEAGCVVNVDRHEIRQSNFVCGVYPPTASASDLVNTAAQTILATIHTVYSDGTERRWFDKIQKKV